jgi:hypothetical protein
MRVAEAVREACDRAAGGTEYSRDLHDPEQVDLAAIVDRIASEG